MKYYIDDLLDGPCIFFYSDGFIKRQSNFKEGKENGIVTRFDEFGQIERIYIYKNGKLNGFQNFFEEGYLSASTLC
jgi:antitoxin component YwqK of YwqJK toxin-antitoxin module